MRNVDDYKLGQAKVSATEVKLAETLIKASTAKKFDIGQYKDEYVNKLRTLIDAKVEGEDRRAPWRGRAGGR